MGAISTSSPALWLKADAITGLSDGAAVASWVDSSGNGNTATQGTSAAQPTYKTAIQNGLAVVRFDGSDALASAASASGSKTLAVALKATGSGAVRTLFGSSASGGMQVFLNEAYRVGSSKQGIGPISLSADVVASSGEWHVAVYTFTSGSAWSTEIDGAAAGSGTTSTTLTASLSAVIGSPGGVGGQYFTGDLGELVSWDRVLNSTERADVAAELKAKWATIDAPLAGITYTSDSTFSGDWLAQYLGDGAVGYTGLPTYSYSSASGSAVHWIKMQLAASKVVDRYRIVARTDAPTYSPGAWTFEGSNDGSTWTTLDTRSGQTYSSGEAKTFTCSNTTSYAYYRLNVTASQNNTALTFSELSLFQSTAPTIPASYAGSPASIVVSAPAGSFAAGTKIPASYTGAPAAVTVSAPAGAFTAGTAVPAAFTGSPATVAVAAPAGSFVAGSKISADFTGTPADLTIDAPLGSFTVETPSAQSFTGTPALVVVTAPTGGYLLTSGTAEDVATAVEDAADPIALTIGAAESLAYAAEDAGDPIRLAIEQIDSIAEAWAEAYASYAVTLEPNGKPQYRLKVVDKFGNEICELNDVAIGTATRSLNGRGGLDFNLSKLHPQLADVKQFSEVQLWRGSHLVPGGWFTVVDPRIDEGGTTFGYDCAGLSYYFERVYIGKERPELILNGGFEEGARYWGFSYSPGSNAEVPPRWEIISDAREGGKALRIFAEDSVQTVKRTVESAAVFVPNSASFLSGGEAAIRAQVEDIPNGTHITVEGHTADSDGGTGYALSVARAEAAAAVIHAYKPTLVITTVGKGETEPVDPRHTEAAYRKNRRVVIIANVTQTKVGHRQFGGQVFTYVNDTGEALEIDVQAECRVDEYEAPSKDGRMLYADVRLASAPNVPLNDGEVRVDEYTPVGRWLGQSTTVKVPAGGQPYRVNVRLFPTAGSTTFDLVSAKPNFKLTYTQVDPRHVIGGLVEHAQDPDFGKGDFNIQPFGPLSGFQIDRSWEWKAHMPVQEAIGDVVSTLNGPDANIAVTPRRRLLVIHPKQGSSNGFVLAAGDCAGDARILSYAAGVDGDQVATTAIVQASWSGGGGSEVFAREARTDGLVLERLFTSEQDTPTATLLDQAHTAVKYGHSDVVTRVVMHPDDTTVLMERVTIGDIVTVAIADGRVQVNEEYRITQIDLDPEFDRLSYTLALEV